ncbi:RHTO0S06e08482g2_1 [Rhodotorula toruloides]|uniref:RHTO0S06e08482g2_1 n=1 Tax=Rhodotorula toruloides TaxID=5286 RepID=A0A061AWT5_RHOTO|nr:RHTO0S06e08482g2_1 [Rhodotorula toruloides]
MVSLSASTQTSASSSSPPAFYYAKTRQALCEALPMHFRSYQGGVYTSDGRLRGLLLDTHDSLDPAGLGDGQSLVTHLGSFEGDAATETVDTNLGQSRLEAARLAADEGDRVLVIIGRLQPFAPVSSVSFPSGKRPRYLVLGFYNVQDVHLLPALPQTPFGPVNSTSVSTAKIAITLSWCADQGLPYWLPAISPHNVPASSSSAPTLIRPLLFSEASTKRFHYSRDTARGTACDRCGQLALELHWGIFACDSCDYAVSQRLIPWFPKLVREVNLQPKPPPRSLAPTVRRIGGYEITTWNLDRSNRIVRLRPLKSTEFEDDLFCDLQLPEAAHQLVRGKMRRCRVPAMATSHYACNIGATYDYGVEIPTFPLPSLDSDGDAPDSSLPSLASLARRHVESVIHRVLKRKVRFNEVLTIGYRAGTRISAHQDAERGVKDFIASLSLGGSAVLTFEESGKPDDMDDKTNKRIKFGVELRHADILVMQGTRIQHEWKHGLESDTLLQTFRDIEPRAS